MKLNSLTSNPVLIYLLKFFAIFCIAYFGTLAVVGLAAPGGKLYSPFVQQYLNYVGWIRASLLYTSRFFLSLFGYHSQISNSYSLQVVGGKSVHIGYTCIGYGVFSFWMAFVLANAGLGIKKICWVIGGWVILWLINIMRICLLLITLNENKKMPFNLDNHTFFNICAYIAIFILIYFFDKKRAVGSG